MLCRPCRRSSSEGAGAAVLPGLPDTSAPWNAKRASLGAKGDKKRLLCVGEKVEAKYGGVRSMGNKWFSGTVAAVSSDGGLTYSINYADGDKVHPHSNSNPNPNPNPNPSPNPHPLTPKQARPSLSRSRTSGRRYPYTRAIRYGGWCRGGGRYPYTRAIRYTTLVTHVPPLPLLHHPHTFTHMPCPGAPRAHCPQRSQRLRVPR